MSGFERVESALVICNYYLRKIGICTYKESEKLLALSLIKRVTDEGGHQKSPQDLKISDMSEEYKLGRQK